MTGHWVQKWKQSSTISLKDKIPTRQVNHRSSSSRNQFLWILALTSFSIVLTSHHSHAHHTILSTLHPRLSRPSKFSPSAIMHHKRNENNSPVQQFAFMCLSNGCKVNIYLILRRTCFTVLPFHQVNLSSYPLSVSLSLSFHELRPLLYKVNIALSCNFY